MQPPSYCQMCADKGYSNTSAAEAALHGVEINTVDELYLYLKQNHSQISNLFHDALYQMVMREFYNSIVLAS